MSFRKICKIRQNPPKLAKSANTHQLRVFPKICGSWPQSHHWGVDGDGFFCLGRHLGPPSLCNKLFLFFALFFIVTCYRGILIDVSCSSWSNLAFWCYAAIVGWLLTAAPHKNQHPQRTCKPTLATEIQAIWSHELLLQMYFEIAVQEYMNTWVQGYNEFDFFGNRTQTLCAKLKN